MIRRLSVVAVLGALCGHASAQSSVTLSGSLDGGIRYTDTSAGKEYSADNAGWLSSNLFTLTGRDELGDGWVSYFRLSAGYYLGSGEINNGGTADLFYKYASYVGIRGPYGNVVVGRQFTLAHDVVYPYDPFNLNYPDLIPVSDAAAGFLVNNDVKYIANVGGLTFRAENSFGGVAGDFNESAQRGIGMDYTWSWLEVGAGYEYRNLQSGTTWQPDNYYTFGAVAHFGPVRLAGGYMNNNEEQPVGIAPLRTLNYWGGATYDISPTVRLGVGYYITDLPNQEGKRSLGIGSLVYSLSATTRLYAEVDYTKYAGTYITNTSLNASRTPRQLGVAVGLNHSF